MAQRQAELTPHASPAHFWGAELRTRRLAKGMSLDALGKLVYRDRSYLAKIERGQRSIPPDLARACDQAVGAEGTLIRLHALIASTDGGYVASSDDDVANAPDRVARDASPLDHGASLADLLPTPRSGGSPHQSGLAIPRPPAIAEHGDSDYLESIRGYIRSLISLDNRFGGADLVKIAVRFFNSLHNQLGAGSYDRSIETDLNAAAGELAEVVGWLAYDAELHDLVRRMNQESLYFSRLAGDRTIELLTLQNSSMHAAVMGRPNEALQLARSVLDGHTLSPRLRALFLTRQARAMAQMGDESAIAVFPQVKSLFQEGVTENDPAWAWWIDERELAWHEAMAQRDLRRAGLAISEFEHSVEATPITETRSQYLHRAYLLQAQVDTESWADVENTIKSIIPLVSEVASTRTVVLLRDVLARIACRDAVPGRIATSVTQLTAALDMLVL